MTSRCSPPLFSQTRVDVVNSAMETKNPARCTMSMSATHTSGFNTGSDNQNKWLLFPLYSTCQHSPLKGGGGGDARGSGSDVARPGLGEGGGVRPSPGRAPRPPGSQGKYLLCWPWTGSPGLQACTGRGHGGGALPSLERGLAGRAGRIVQPPGARAPEPRLLLRQMLGWGGRPGTGPEGGVGKRGARLKTSQGTEWAW